MSEDAFDKIVNDVRYSPFQRQLAARLGCDVDKVTVENLVALVEALEPFADERHEWKLSDKEMFEERAVFIKYPNIGESDAMFTTSDLLEAYKALAPFKREAG